MNILGKDINNVICSFIDENEKTLVKRLKGYWDLSICYICNTPLKKIFKTDFFCEFF